MDLKHQNASIEEAARWHARLQANDCSDSERIAFARWVQEESHARAFELAKEVSSQLDALSQDTRLQQLANLALGNPRTSVSNKCRRWAVPVSLAASVVGAVLSFQWLTTREAVQELAYHTVDGEQRTVMLADGSAVHLDVGTSITVRLNQKRRQIRLQAGRAYFEVAHDASRPFTVAASDSLTTALGTRFVVQDLGEKAVITLAEGSVAITDALDATRWSERLVPGEQLSVDAHAATREKHNIDPQLAVSWTYGRHIFRGTRLADAIVEVNRYATRKVRLGDPSLADLEVAGNFIAGDSEQIVAAFAAALPLRVVSAGADEIILFRRYNSRDD
jgi:transmembrane sensor